MKPVATACLLCLSSMVFIYPCCAQTSSLDSLSAALKTAKEDTNKVRLLKRIVFVWSDTNLDSAKIYLDEMKSLSAKLDFPEGIIYADVKLGEIYNVNGNFEKATEVNNANLAYASEKGTPYQRADVYKTVAMTYSMQQRNDSALSYYLKALNVYDDHSDSLNMAKVMTNIAVVHDNMGDHKKSIEFCKRSKEIFKGKDRNAYLVTLSNLALYEAYDRQYDAAKANYTEALQMAEAERNYNSLAHIYSGLMDVVYWKKQYPEISEKDISHEDYLFALFRTLFTDIINTCGLIIETIESKKSKETRTRINEEIYEELIDTIKSRVDSYPEFNDFYNKTVEAIGDKKRFK